MYWIPRTPDVSSLENRYWGNTLQYPRTVYWWNTFNSFPYHPQVTYIAAPSTQIPYFVFSKIQSPFSVPEPPGPHRPLMVKLNKWTFMNEKSREMWWLSKLSVERRDEKRTFLIHRTRLQGKTKLRIDRRLVKATLKPGVRLVLWGVIRHLGYVRLLRKTRWGRTSLWTFPWSCRVVRNRGSTFLVCV